MIQIIKLRGMCLDIAPQKKEPMRILFTILLSGCMLAWTSCGNNQSSTTESSNTETAVSVGQSGVQDDDSSPNVVKVAISSKDHTTLVAAIQAAALVDALSNAGPFTVFAPTNAAFDQLPAGTVDNLLKPEQLTNLQNVLQYHVWVGVINQEMMKDGQVLNMVNGDNVTLHVKDGKVMVGEANIVGSVRASNGIVYVIDKVLLPPAAN
jgi:uncharacterized surface protein with fasciclin (FAS1) repeats